MTTVPMEFVDGLGLEVIGERDLAMASGQCLTFLDSIPLAWRRLLWRVMLRGGVFCSMVNCIRRYTAYFPL